MNGVAGRPAGKLFTAGAGSLQLTHFSIHVYFHILIYSFIHLFLLNYFCFGEIFGKQRFSPRSDFEATNPGNLCTELSTDSVSNPKAGNATIRPPARRRAHAR